jgi:hypothetical protein
VGLTGDPETQADVARDLGKGQPQISNACTQGLERLDVAVLAEPLAVLDAMLDGLGGVAHLDDVARRFEEEWTPDVVTGAGMVRLLERLAAGRVQIVDLGDDAA